MGTNSSEHFGNCVQCWEIQPTLKNAFNASMYGSFCLFQLNKDEWDEYLFACVRVCGYNAFTYASLLYQSYRIDIELYRYFRMWFFCLTNNTNLEIDFRLINNWSWSKSFYINMREYVCFRFFAVSASEWSVCSRLNWINLRTCDAIVRSFFFVYFVIRHF